jgi:hypothetical protein
MLDTHKIAYNYAMAMKLQRVAEERVSDAFAALGSDNQIFGLAEPLEAAYNDLVLELLGSELFEWVMWWIYETEYGTKDMEFIINGTSYDPTTMTMFKFLMLVDPPKELMGS